MKVLIKDSGMPYKCKYSGSWKAQVYVKSVDGKRLLKKDSSHSINLSILNSGKVTKAMADEILKELLTKELDLVWNITSNGFGKCFNINLVSFICFSVNKCEYFDNKPEAVQFLKLEIKRLEQEFNQPKHLKVA